MPPQRPRPVRRRFRTPHYRAFNLAVLGLFALAVIGGILEPDLPGTGPDWVGWLILAAVLILMYRAARLGLTVTRDEVIVHSFLTTRHIPRERITRVGTAFYDGLWAGGTELECLTQLELTLTNRESPLGIPALTATRKGRRLPLIAHRLRQTLRETDACYIGKEYSP